MVMVDIQATDGDSTSIRKGLSAGDKVVTDGLERLRPGSLVAINKPEAASAPKNNP
jgi:multidrug efflux pump subunit AcrA (membrane-fusion protein)